jgi:hypothetical protein
VTSSGTSSGTDGHNAAEYMEKATPYISVRKAGRDGLKGRVFKTRPIPRMHHGESLHLSDQCSNWKLWPPNDG